ncbi:MAG: metal-dependent hydrolase [Halieaceae bacterium]|nr:metal-dependent hydrolase [Halieaceae bacterium]
MDPLSQAALGAVVPQVAMRHRDIARLTLVGALAGMAPDLDVLISSEQDPLLFLEYHRQFTHSLIFIPVGALLCALAFWKTIGRGIDFLTLWLASILGYLTHGLLDACTTYGTLLLWPFSDVRIAWNTIAVIDPLFTLPLLFGVLWGVFRQSVWAPRFGLVWAMAYLALSSFQHDRALAIGEGLAESRGHSVISVSAKPTLGNILLWKVIYRYEGQFWVDAVRVGVTAQVFPGGSVAAFDPRVHLTWLQPGSQQALDLERFRWFSNDYLAIDESDPFLVVDMRYSLLPNEIKGLWGIQFDPEADAMQHVSYQTQRSVDSGRAKRLWGMLRGDEPESLGGL